MNPDRLLFSKKFALARTPDEQLKILKTEFLWLRFSSLLLLIISIIGLCFFSGFIWTPTYDHLEVNVSELTPAEQAHVYDTLREFKPVCRKLQKSMTFTHNITRYVEKYEGRAAAEKGDILGFNHFSNGNIFMQYTDDTEALKELISHEASHSFARISNPSHDMVYELGYQKVCFEKSKRLYLELT
jgi:hypothetical protein